MTAGLLTVFALLSVVFLPWPVWATAAAIAALFEPLVPLAAGILADTLYFAPHAGSLPLYSLLGALVSLAAFFVRSRLKTGSIGG